MLSEEKQIVTRVLERYLRTGSIEDEQVQVNILAENKSSVLEKIGEDNRSIMLDQYQVDLKKVWAGYSTRNKIVYVSLVT